jgi:hypothetical protein
MSPCDPGDICILRMQRIMLEADGLAHLVEDFLGRCSMVHTSRVSLEDGHARSRCLSEYGLTDKRLWSLKVLQASGTLAVREPHEGERRVACAYRPDIGAAVLVL